MNPVEYLAQVVSALHAALEGLDMSQRDLMDWLALTFLDITPSGDAEQDLSPDEEPDWVPATARRLLPPPRFGTLYAQAAPRVRQRARLRLTQAVLEGMADGTVASPRRCAAALLTLYET